MLHERFGMEHTTIQLESQELAQIVTRGAIRGLTRDGVTVSIGTKIIEVDPRDQAITSGIEERPARIADGVTRAIQTWRKRARSQRRDCGS